MPVRELPLFPLRTVLFPGGVLGLRVFERRYLDLVRDCAHHNRGFGVCLLLEGSESGGPVAATAAWGTEARIEDFDALPDGLLGITVRGSRRFHVERTRVRDSGLIVADVVWRQSEPEQPVQPEHSLLAMLLEQLIERFGGPHARAPRALHDDADWVSWRLGEFLPLSLSQRQALLQLADPYARLQQLIDEIARNDDATDAR